MIPPPPFLQSVCPVYFKDLLFQTQHTAFFTSRPRTTSSSPDFYCKHLASSNFGVLTHSIISWRGISSYSLKINRCSFRLRKLYKMSFYEMEQEVSPRPLRNLLTPLCSLPGSESRYSCALISNRPESAHRLLTTSRINYSKTAMTNPPPVPLRPCLRRSLSWIKPVNIWVSMNTSKNLLKLLEVTALRKASRWKEGGDEVGLEEEGLGEVGEVRDSSSRSAPPMKRE